jgi:hypothetical protein
LNRIRLLGRVGKKTLEPGIYAVTLQIEGREGASLQRPVFARVRSARDVRPAAQRRGQVAFAACSRNPVAPEFAGSGSTPGKGAGAGAAAPGVFLPPPPQASGPSEPTRRSVVPHVVKATAEAIAAAGRDPLSFPTVILAGVVTLSVLIFLGLAIRRRFLPGRTVH